MSRSELGLYAPHEFDEYIGAQALDFRAMLEQVRTIIKTVAPDCAERVSYKIPVSRLEKDFVAMSAAKSHCSLHTMSRVTPVAMKGEIEAAGIWTSDTALHIKPGVDLPVALLDKALRARLAELECR